MHSGCATFGKRFARTLIAFLVVLIALGRPLDAAAHVATLEVEAGSTSQLLTFIAAFDVIDDAFDHESGENPNETTQLVIQMAMPERDAIGLATAIERAVEHAQRLPDAVISNSLLPLERPPRA